jgi:NAD(P)H-dependent flavin oxidoreductase YrpB (nitropropane dioxygenase family)
MALRTRFTTMFGCRHPLQQAGMGGITTPDLALAVASSGALGMLSAKDTPLSELLDAVPVGAVIGVNSLTPGREDFPAVQEAAARMPYVECFWAEPDPELVRIIHAGGALAGWQVGSAREARVAENAGCDLIIAEGVEAGGHVRGPRPSVGRGHKPRESPRFWCCWRPLSRRRQRLAITAAQMTPWSAAALSRYGSGGVRQGQVRARRSRT